MEAMHDGLINPCIEKEGASANDVNEAKVHSVPTTKAGKCLRACVLESVGVVRENYTSEFSFTLLIFHIFNN